MANKTTDGQHPHTVRIVLDNNVMGYLRLAQGLAEGLSNPEFSTGCFPNTRIAMPRGIAMEATGVFSPGIEERIENRRTLTDESAENAPTLHLTRAGSHKGFIARLESVDFLEWLPITEYDEEFFRRAQLVLLDRRLSECVSLKDCSIEDLKAIEAAYMVRPALLGDDPITQEMKKDYGEEAFAQWYREYLTEAKGTRDLSQEILIFASDDKGAHAAVQKAAGGRKRRNHCWTLSGPHFVALTRDVAVTLGRDIVSSKRELYKEHRHQFDQARDTFRRQFGDDAFKRFSKEVRPLLKMLRTAEFARIDPIEPPKPLTHKQRESRRRQQGGQGGGHQR